MTTLSSYRELVVWEKSMGLAEKVYQATASLPSEERFGLASQMRRAAVSIPSNIAEGQSRNSTGEFMQFPGVAKGSVGELETQAELAARLKMIPPATHQALANDLQEIGKMLNGLIRSLRSKR